MIGLLAALACAPAAADSLLDQAREIVREGERYARLWPGFWPAGQPFILYRPGRDCIMHSPARTPQGFRQVDDGAALWRGWCREDLFQSPILLSQQVGGVEVAGVRDDGRGKDLGAFLLHEAFHDFQRERFKSFSDRDTDWLNFEFPVEAAWLDTKLRETVLLLEAVGRDDPEARATLVRAAIALRERRLREMPPAAAAVEDRYMLNEGTATYVELASQGAVAGAATARDLTQAAMTMRQAVSPWEFLLRWQSYQTGAAAALLLDAMSLPDWQARVMRGETLYRLLAEASDYDPRDAEALRDLAESIPLPGLDDLRRQLQRNASFTASARKRFQRAARHRLLVRLPETAASSFSSREVFSVEGRVLVLDPDPFIASHAGVELKVSGRPVLLPRPGADADQAAGFAEIALRKAPKIAGCPSRERSECPAGTRIRASGLELLLKQAAIVERGDAMTRVWFAPPDATTAALDPAGAVHQGRDPGR